MKVENLDLVLSQNLDAAGEEGSVDVLVVVDGKLDEAGTQHAIGEIRQEVEQGAELFYAMPSLGIIRLRAPGWLVKQIVDHDEIVSASFAGRSR